MSEKEKALINKLTESITQLDEPKQQYVLGITEGMAIMKKLEEGANEDEKE